MYLNCESFRNTLLLLNFLTGILLLLPLGFRLNLVLQSSMLTRITNLVETIDSLVTFLFLSHNS
jgi:hypothetical protein